MIYYIVIFISNICKNILINSFDFPRIIYIIKNNFCIIIIYFVINICGKFNYSYNSLLNSNDFEKIIQKQFP